jgi:hypothetical protein
MDVSTSALSPLQAALRKAAFAAGEERRAQRWLAETTGIHESDISRIVGGMDPGQARAQVIADALATTVTDCGWPQYAQAEAA